MSSVNTGKKSHPFNDMHTSLSSRYNYEGVGFFCPPQMSFYDHTRLMLFFLEQNLCIGPISGIFGFTGGSFVLCIS